MKLWLKLCGVLLIAGLATVLAVNNRHAVALSLFPLPYEISAPLYLILCLAFVAGFGISRLGIALSGIRQKQALKHSQKRVAALENALQATSIEQALLARRTKP